MHRLVPIQPVGSRPPLYWIPGGRAISSLSFREVSLLLGSDQPVYGLESRLPERGEESESIPERATQYIRQIRSLQPEGPYFLAGFCFGGLVAFEMAQQLHAEGQQVALLALVSCVLPGYEEHSVRKFRIKVQRFRYHLAKAQTLTPERAQGISLALFDQRLPRCKRA